MGQEERFAVGIGKFGARSAGDVDHLGIDGKYVCWVYRNTLMKHRRVLWDFFWFSLGGMLDNSYV